MNTILDYLKVFNNINKRPAYKPRTMAQGGGMMGQLVAPSVDGSRPGYSGDYTAAQKKKQGRTLVNRDGKLTLDMHTPEIKKWYKKNYPDKSWWDQKYKSDILDRYYNELGREKPPKGYITTKEYAKKYGFKIYPAKGAKAEGNIISNLLRRQGDERAITRGYDEKTKNFFTKELESRYFKTTYELAPGKKSSREILYVKDKGKIHAKNLLKYWDSTQLRDHTMKNVDNLLNKEKYKPLKKLFEVGNYDGIKKALEGVKGLTNAEKAQVMLRIAQGMSGHNFRDYKPNIKLNKVAANRIFKGFEKEPWNTPFSGAYRDLKRHVIAKNIGGEYFTKSYQGFIDDARGAIKKALPSLDISKMDINELTGLTSGYKNKTFSSTQFINLMDADFNRKQHATMIKEYGNAEARLQSALKGKNPSEARQVVKDWETWRKKWYKGLDDKFKTKAIRNILPTFTLGKDPYAKVVSKKRLSELAGLDFNIREEGIKSGYGKTFKSIEKQPILREVAMGNKNAIKFVTTLSGTLQDLSPRDIAQLAKEHDCTGQAKGGSIMTCLQGKFRADPEKFLQKSAPLAKNNVNLFKWFKNGRKIARGTGIALAWEAAFAPIIAGWGALEGQSGQRILNDIAYGIPFIGETEKEEWMRESGDNELAYKMKRIGELENQELPYLDFQRDEVINKMSNVEGKSFHQRTIEDDIKEKKLELQGLKNTPEFYEGPAASYYNEPVIQGAFDLEQQTTAKIAADTAERKKATFDWLEKNRLYGNQNWPSQVYPYRRAEGGIMNLKKKW